MIEHLHFYYSNDLHSHFEKWPSIVHYFKHNKEKHDREKEENWRIDIGDHVDRFHPIAEAFKGKVNVELLDQAGYDFATIGNNEGITLEYNDLFHLYDDAAFQVSCANLKSQDHKKPTWLKESIITTTKSGINIKMIGLTAPFHPFYEPLGWEVESPFTYLSRERETLKQGADILILLSHLGLSDDEAIARDYPEFDVIIGGHSHHLLKNGQYVDHTLLTAAGKHGGYIGEVHIDWNHDQKRIVSKQAFTVDTETLEQDEETEKALEKWNRNAVIQLSQPITQLEKSLNVDWFTSTTLIENLTATLKEWTDADISMLNAGILLEGLEKGIVTYGDIHRICPHPINPCTIQLRGIEIIEVVRGAYDEKLENLHLKGFGFRGKVVGKLIFSGIDVVIQPDNGGNQQIIDVLYQSKSIDKDQSYTFATADMFTFGNMFPEIVRSTTKEFFLPEFMRDLVVKTIQ